MVHHECEFQMIESLRTSSSKMGLDVKLQRYDIHKQKITLKFFIQILQYYQRIYKQNDQYQHLNTKLKFRVKLISDIIRKGELNQLVIPGQIRKVRNLIDQSIHFFRNQKIILRLQRHYILDCITLKCLQMRSRWNEIQILIHSNNGENDQIYY
ncbi:unnamed protein product [Paramecium octaurelia]|uniref:Uncharacterized protein n=1 Tax=Paramecium octaurelia TaxID=43137 RepID=A0A8S1YP14_PAROT|nr:unnamed protein product [Paramecium octaurelia]